MSIFEGVTAVLSWIEKLLPFANSLRGTAPEILLEQVPNYNYHEGQHVLIIKNVVDKPLIIERIMQRENGRNEEELTWQTGTETTLDVLRMVKYGDKNPLRIAPMKDARIQLRYGNPPIYKIDLAIWWKLDGTQPSTTQILNFKRSADQLKYIYTAVEATKTTAE